MILALFRMSKIYWRSFLYTYIISIDGSKFDLYYLYCLSMFQRTLLFKFCFVSKAGAKVRTLKHNFQMFPEVFFIFLFQNRSSERNLWQRREKWKLTAPFYCQNVKTSPPSFPKADAKVALLRTSAKYIQAFFWGFTWTFFITSWLIDMF